MADKLSPAAIKTILLNAELEAAKATAEKLAELGDNWYPCGFAWVKVRPARGPFVQMMKDLKMGKTDDFEGGFRVYNPSKNHTQSMVAKEAGAEKFAEILRSHGLKAYAQTRMD